MSSPTHPAPEYDHRDAVVCLLRGHCPLDHTHALARFERAFPASGRDVTLDCLSCDLTYQTGPTPLIQVIRFGRLISGTTGHGQVHAKFAAHPAMFRDPRAVEVFLTRLSQRLDLEIRVRQLESDGVGR